MKKVNSEKLIKALVDITLKTYVIALTDKRPEEIEEFYNNRYLEPCFVSIGSLYEEMSYYESVVRLLGTSFNTIIEDLPMDIASIFYDVETSIRGKISNEHAKLIKRLLNEYAKGVRKPSVDDYSKLRIKTRTGKTISRKYENAFYLIDRVKDIYYILRLKNDTRLDIRTATLEKEGLLFQLAILYNKLPKNTEIKCYFGVPSFNKSTLLEQEAVKRFFAKEEILAGTDFWNFVCKSRKGQEIVSDVIRRNIKVLNGLLAYKQKYFQVRV